MRIVAAVHDELEGSLDCAHDARVLASAFGLSAATLNQYFSRAYGSTVAGYLRKRRMEVAAALLARGARVAEAAVRVGYANPSKFSSAFKREYGTATERVEAASIRREGGRSRSQGGVLGTLTARRLAGGMVTEPNQFLTAGYSSPFRAGAERGLSDLQSPSVNKALIRLRARARLYFTARSEHPLATGDLPDGELGDRVHEEAAELDRREPGQRRGELVRPAPAEKVENRVGLRPRDRDGSIQSRRG